MNHTLNKTEGEMIVLITESKETKVSSDPREKENKNAEMKYELTFRKRDELKLLWQALYKAALKMHVIPEKEKYTELMKSRFYLMIS